MYRRACVCVGRPFFSWGKCVPYRVRSSGTRWGPASAHQLTARASLRPSNTSDHEPANNSLKLMHTPHHRLSYIPNGRHGSGSEKIKQKTFLHEVRRLLHKTILGYNLMQRFSASKLPRLEHLITGQWATGARAPATYGERARAGRVTRLFSLYDKLEAIKC